ncbi:MAG: glycosyltransferase family 39 protein [Chloroflexi bacterium]|nr:glycosyltransferase family 39 protein [Chloroflexota bacterium]
MSKINQRTRCSLLFLLLVSFAWRVQGLANQSLWRDEVDAVYFALRNLRETLAMFVRVADNGALYFLMLRGWFNLVGASEFALRYPSVMASTLSVVLLWQVARRLVFVRNTDARHEPVGALILETPPLEANLRPDRPMRFGTLFSAPLLAATFLALNPYQLWYAQEGKMYAVITCLALLATWFWLTGIERGGWQRWLGYLITVSIAMYTHLLMVLLIPFHLVWFLIAWPQSRRQWQGYGLALAGLTLPYLPMVWWQWAMLTTSEHRTGFTFVPLRETVRSLILSHSRGFLPSDDLLPLTPLFFLALAGLVLGVYEMGHTTAKPDAELSAWRRFLLVISWIIVPVLAIYALSLRQAIFTERYVIWIAPAIMLLLALGVQVVIYNAGTFARWLAGLLVVYLLGFWLYVGWQQKTTPMKYDLRDAVTYIAQRRQPATLLILQIPHMQYSYRYYSGDFSVHYLDGSDTRLGDWVGGLWTNDGKSATDVDQQMQALTADTTELWVLRSEVEMWDSRHLMDEWLDQHGTVVDQAEFLGTQVKHYQLHK